MFNFSVAYVYLQITKIIVCNMCSLAYVHMLVAGARVAAPVGWGWLAEGLVFEKRSFSLCDNRRTVLYVNSEFSVQRVIIRPIDRDVLLNLCLFVFKSTLPSLEIQSSEIRMS